MLRRYVLFVCLVLMTAVLPPVILSHLGSAAGAVFAKGGDDDDDDNSGSGKGGGSGRGGGDDDDDDDDNSGSGGGGRGGDDDDDDDDNSGSGGGGHGGDDDDDDDDSGGSGGNSGSGGGGNGNSGSGGGGNGGKAAPGGNAKPDAPGGSGDRIFRDDVIRLTYANGTSERIYKGQYERRDRSGRIVERHRATREDQARLRGLRETIAREGAALGLQVAVVVNSRQSAVQVTDAAGWSETVASGTYTLTDPNGNVVTRRSATSKDITRLKTAAGLR